MSSDDKHDFKVGMVAIFVCIFVCFMCLKGCSMYMDEIQDRLKGNGDRTEAAIMEDIMYQEERQAEALERIADALERLNK